MSVRQCQAEIDAQEFAEWAAYDQLEPFGEERADLRAALIAYTMACAWHSGKGRPKFDDFLLKFDRPARRQQSAAEIRAKLMLFSQAHNHGAKRGKHG